MMIDFVFLTLAAMATMKDAIPTRNMKCPGYPTFERPEYTHNAGAEPPPNSITFALFSLIGIK